MWICIGHSRHYCGIFEQKTKLDRYERERFRRRRSGSVASLAQEADDT